jgi:hypothetical protein
VNDGAARCEGEPSFLAKGSVENNYCFQNEYPTQSSGFWTDMVFLSCTAGRSAVCAWTAAINTFTSLVQNGVQYLCTTGSTQGPPYETYNGTNWPGFQLAPSIAGNEFAHLPQASLGPGTIPQLDAPFQIGNCLIPSYRQVGAPFRSYRAYCSLAQVPIQWQNLPQSIGPYQH